MEKFDDSNFLIFDKSMLEVVPIEIGTCWCDLFKT